MEYLGSAVGARLLRHQLPGTPPVGTIAGTNTFGARTYTVAAGNWLGANFITAGDIKPETAKTWNAGAIWDSRGFGAGHSFRLIVD